MSAESSVSKSYWLEVIVWSEVMKCTAGDAAEDIGCRRNINISLAVLESLMPCRKQIQWSKVAMGIAMNTLFSGLHWFSNIFNTTLGIEFSI